MTSSTLGVPPAAPSRRRPFRLWLAGIAAGSLAAVLIAPTTGWIARGELAVSVGVPGNPAESSLAELGDRAYRAPSANLESRQRILDSRPNDFPIHLAAAMDAGRAAQERLAIDLPTTTIAPKRAYAVTAEIRKLVNRFGREPGLFATTIRMDTLGAVRILRAEKEIIKGDHVSTTPGFPDAEPSPEALAAFDRDAERGEALEPDNGYFPTMRSVGYFAAHRDAEAIAALARAAHCAHWDEHLRDELTGRLRLSDIETGSRSATRHIAIVAAILFPHLSQVRAASQMATVTAMRLEQAGKASEAARIRGNVMRVGDLIRSDSTSLIGDLVGVATIQLAMERPGGAEPIKQQEAATGTGFLAHDRDEMARARFARLAAYWEKEGLGGEAPLAKERLEVGIRTRNLISRSIALSPFNEQTGATLSILWSVGILILANTWWLLAAGGLAAIVQTRRSIAGRVPMPRSGPFVLIVAGVLCVVLAANMMQHQWQFVRSTSRVALLLRGLEGRTTNGSDEVVLASIATALTFALPLAVGLGAVIVSVVRRVRLRVGLSQAYSRVGISIASLAVLGFCALTVWTARIEQRTTADVREVLVHEGRMLAKLVNAEWPAPVD